MGHFSKFLNFVYCANREERHETCQLNQSPSLSLAEKTVKQFGDTSEALEAYMLKSHFIQYPPKIYFIFKCDVNFNILVPLELGGWSSKNELYRLVYEGPHVGGACLPLILLSAWLLFGSRGWESKSIPCFD